MTPGANSSLYVAVGSVIAIAAIAATVRAISPAAARTSPDSSKPSMISFGKPGAPRDKMPATAMPGGAAYRVEDAAPIMVGGQTGLAVRYTGEGLDAAAKEAAANDIFRRMRPEAEDAGIQLIVISYGSDAAGGGAGAKDPTGDAVFVHQSDGTWARLRSDAPGAAGSGAAGAVPAPSGAVPAPK